MIMRRALIPGLLAVVLGSADPRDVHLLTPDRTAVVTLSR